MKKGTRQSGDPRVRHAGKAGAHHKRSDDVRKGRSRKSKHKAPRHRRWRSEE